MVYTTELWKWLKTIDPIYRSEIATKKSSALIRYSSMATIPRTLTRRLFNWNGAIDLTEYLEVLWFSFYSLRLKPLILLDQKYGDNPIEVEICFPFPPLLEFSQVSSSSLTELHNKMTNIQASHLILPWDQLDRTSPRLLQSHRQIHKVRTQISHLSTSNSLRRLGTI